MDRVGDLPDVLQRGGQIALHLGQALGRGRIPSEQLLAHQPGPGRQRHDLLLDPVVRIRWDPAAFGVLARHHPVAGRRQFGRLDPDLLDPPGEFRGQVQVVHAHRGLGREVRQQPAVLGQQRAVRTRPALDVSEDGCRDIRWARSQPGHRRRAVRDHPQRPFRRIQRHPGPGQAQAAADLPGQLAEQPVGAGPRSGSVRTG